MLNKLFYKTTLLILAALTTIVVHTGPEENAALLKAASDDFSLKGVKKALSDGADINATDEYNRTALQISLYRHSLKIQTDSALEIAQCLIKNGAKIDTMNKWGWPPLDEYQKPQVLQKNDVDKCNKLLQAVRNGNLAKSQLLIKAGIDSNSKDKNSGDTLLHIAAENGDSQLVSYLLNHGAKNTTNAKGWLPFERAVLNGHRTTGNIILQYRPLKTDS
ncbi:hypothetical protein HOL34_02845 [bacterium]|jgi:ankyrin repeat protein|nr:hypothetical protein [bacterium]MBT3903397.1 hypothetical protein [bacterium]MBT4577592.1 hypothetical protein [bacterium]MBT5345752.1 hypothetical protein [bacterium]MBT6130907.1 hypothetical protein [bacterium]